MKGEVERLMAGWEADPRIPRGVVHDLRALLLRDDVEGHAPRLVELWRDVAGRSDRDERRGLLDAATGLEKLVREWRVQGGRPSA